MDNDNPDEAATMEAKNSTSPLSHVHEMQLRTRKEQGFEDVEASLPDRQRSRIADFHLTSLLSHLGSRNPFGLPVTGQDLLWLFDNTAFKPSHSSSWQAEFVAAVFEQEPKCKVADAVASIADKLGLATDAVERKTIEKRLMPFLLDVRPGRQVRAVHAKEKIMLGPTGPNGMSSDIVKLSSSGSGTLVQTSASTPSGTEGVLDMQTFYAGAEGWGLISDIDDTIKVTQTSSPTGILRKTFVDPPEAINGMPELYKHAKAVLGDDAPFFYLSASPYNLYPFLRGFRDDFYPPGTIILRDSSWRTLSGLLSSLTLKTGPYKEDRMKKIHAWLPKRKMICVGDSTQSDPEAYGEIYRTFPGWVRLILIHKVTDIAEAGIKDKNEPQRFEKAFEGVPAEAWHLFTDPAECRALIDAAVQRG